MNFICFDQFSPGFFETGATGIIEKLWIIWATSEDFLINGMSSGLKQYFRISLNMTPFNQGRQTSENLRFIESWQNVSE